jgi:hypothetical protein
MRQGKRGAFAMEDKDLNKEYRTPSTKETRLDALCADGRQFRGFSSMRSRRGQSGVSGFGKYVPGNRERVSHDSATL